VPESVKDCGSVDFSSVHCTGNQFEALLGGDILRPVDVNFNKITDIKVFSFEI
jgi:hypothetical protein